VDDGPPCPDIGSTHAEHTVAGANFVNPATLTTRPPQCHPFDKAPHPPFARPITAPIPRLIDSTLKE
jgi:hypothetical protein